MKGISPVIATVLLLLMSVAAVGGAWTWYQKMQSSAQTGGEAGVQSVQRGAHASLIYVDMAYLSGGNLIIDVGNQADTNVTVTSVKYRTSQSSSTYYTCTSSTTIKSNDVTSLTCSQTASGLSSGDTIYVKFYFEGGVTKEVGTVIE